MTLPFFSPPTVVSMSTVAFMVWTLAANWSIFATNSSCVAVFKGTGERVGCTRCERNRQPVGCTDTESVKQLSDGLVPLRANSYSQY